jgi:hypothetical protein
VLVCSFFCVFDFVSQNYYMCVARIARQTARHYSRLLSIDCSLSNKHLCVDRECRRAGVDVVASVFFAIAGVAIFLVLHRRRDARLVHSLCDARHRSTSTTSNTLRILFVCTRVKRLCDGASLSVRCFVWRTCPTIFVSLPRASRRFVANVARTHATDIGFFCIESSNTKQCQNF